MRGSRGPRRSEIRGSWTQKSRRQGLAAGRRPTPEISRRRVARIRYAAGRGRRPRPVCHPPRRRRHLRDGPRPCGCHRALLGRLDQIVLATRLREVRALTGFSRLEPGDPSSGRILGQAWTGCRRLRYSARGSSWHSDVDAVRDWEEGAGGRARFARLEERRAASLMAGGCRRPRRDSSCSTRWPICSSGSSPSSSGYASASLRERVYARSRRSGRDQARGILDLHRRGRSGGTLGGLVRQGKPDRLRPRCWRF